MGKDFDTKAEAEAAARQAKQSLDMPRRWTIRVWENLGWHYALKCGIVQIYTAFDGWHAMISGSVDEETGGCAFSHLPNGPSPRKALIAAIQEVQKRIAADVARQLEVSAFLQAVLAGELHHPKVHKWPPIKLPPSLRPKDDSSSKSRKSRVKSGRGSTTSKRKRSKT